MIADMNSAGTKACPTDNLLFALITGLPLSSYENGIFVLN